MRPLGEEGDFEVKMAINKRPQLEVQRGNHNDFEKVSLFIGLDYKKRRKIMMSSIYIVNLATSRKRTKTYSF
jgi:hypothetical protein